LFNPLVYRFGHQPVAMIKTLKAFILCQAERKERSTKWQRTSV